jgi:hypothetical protein
VYLQESLENCFRGDKIMVFDYLLENISMETNLGITSELNFILNKFSEEKEISKYNIEIQEFGDYFKHNITIKLEQYTEDKAITLFHQFLCFINTNSLNYYSIECFENSIRYKYIMAFEDKGYGYFLSVTFE